MTVSELITWFGNLPIETIFMWFMVIFGGYCISLLVAIVVWGCHL